MREEELKHFRLPPRRFFERDALELAPLLIGAYLRHELPEGIVGGMIVEAEAYRQYDDPGCHAYRGPTNRNRAMFGPPGHAYVYFTYGNHWLFNVVADKEGIGSAVLIRALEPVEGVEIMKLRRPKARRTIDLCNGPGKLASAMGIAEDQYGADLLNSPLKLLIPSSAYRRKLLQQYGGILQTTRIGLSQGEDLPFRFCLASHPCVSKKVRVDKE